MDRQALARRIKEVAYLTGQFTLRSGATSTFYWDKYRFESDPTILKPIASALAAILPAGWDKLAGLEMGGIPLATALSLETGKPCLYVRKEAKPYGTSNLVEGGFQAGDRALVVEDVVTSGGQVVISVQQMRELGFVVQDVVCVIDRQQGGQAAIEKIGCELRPLFTLAELEELAG
ncbi:MAG: orotate phosphoribosyltransferase [Chloroflexota bacterium]